ncbi:MAG TPA: M12 family metallo-peptidase, partial [Saprospiraceae bacterium]|nr:M12 family metallo-peptidase [Saprospiraceae bacterium]
MQYSNAQNSLWQMISENDVQLKVKEIRAAVPDSYELFRLDLNGFKSRLQQAPVRFKATSDIIVVLPGYQGKLQQFRLYEAPLFEQGLQEKYPEIRSYLGQGIDDPSATARISYSPYTGIHAMILSAQYPTVYIDPYTKDKEAYILYDKNNYHRDIDWVCHTEGKGFDAPELRAANANANDGQLRTFRLALACTGEYAQYHLSNQGIPGSATDAVKKAAVLSEMNVAMTRVNGLYERDLAVTMVIVANNTSIIYLNSTTDPYTNNNGQTMLSENQTTCDNIIGSSNYDIGHVFSTGGGGVASLNAPCTTKKARGVTGLGAPIGDAFYIDYVAHEMGHQYGANHTFNSTEGSCGGNRNDATAVEPGSGSTIMSYAGICG